MTREDAIKRYVIPACERMWNEKTCKQIFETITKDEISDKIGQRQQDRDVTFLCPECESRYKDQPTCMWKPMFVYCPICGALMEEGHEK